MREEHKLNKAIKQDGINTQSEILDELKRRYPQYVEQTVKKQAPVRKRKTAFIFAFASVAVCAAIIVPCAVLLPKRGNNNGDGSGNIRYCTQDQYSIVEGVEYTIGEYREDNNRNFLYFDWYELGEDRNTACYISNADNEVLCLEEQVYLPGKDEFVRLSITRLNTYLDVFDFVFERCNGEESVDDHTVKWSINADIALCIFEDNGYRYFIQIDQGQDEGRLFELVSELLETK